MQGPLFKAEYFERAKGPLAEAILRHAENSAAGVLVLWDFVAHHFYDVAIQAAIGAVETGLQRERFIDTLSLPYSPNIHEYLEAPGYPLFVTRFFDFFWSRLPVLFSLNPIIVNGKRRRPSRPEADAVTREALVRWSSRYPQVARQYAFSGEYSQMRLASLPGVPTRVRVRLIERHPWLWRDLERDFPQLPRSENVMYLAQDLLDQCFPMFWNALVGGYRVSCFYWANLGWMKGTKDTREILDAAERERKRNRA